MWIYSTSVACCLAAELARSTAQHGGAFQILSKLMRVLVSVYICDAKRARARDDCIQGQII